MSGQRSTIPWTKIRNGIHYVWWYEPAGLDKAGRPKFRTRRLSLGTSDAVEAQKRFAKFLAGGTDAFSTGGTVGLTVHRALDDYEREHINPNVVDKTRAQNAIKHLKLWFTDAVKNIDIPASRAYALVRRAGVIGGGERSAPIRDVPAYERGLHKFKGEFAAEMAKTDKSTAGLTVDNIRAMAERCGVREMIELVTASGSDNTVRRELVVLNAAANHAARWKRIGPKAEPPTPMPSVELPVETRSERLEEDDYLTLDEFRRARDSATGQLFDFIVITYDSGSRRAAIESLTKFQVDLRLGRVNLRNPAETINQRRSKKRRPVVPIGPDARKVYERLMAEGPKDGYLFGANRDMYRPFREHMEAIGLGHKRNPHILRHSRATHLLQDGVSIYDVAKLLGDTVATVERVYGHHSAEHLNSTINKGVGS